MPSQQSDFAIVLCHGSYHTPAPYGPLLALFKAHGIDAYCPQLPTADLAVLNVGDVSNPDFDLGPPAAGYSQGQEDVQTILGVLQPLVEGGKNVLIIPRVVILREAGLLPRSHARSYRPKLRLRLNLLVASSAFCTWGLL